MDQDNNSTFTISGNDLTIPFNSGECGNSLIIGAPFVYPQSPYTGPNSTIDPCAQLLPPNQNQNWIIDPVQLENLKNFFGKANAIKMAEKFDDENEEAMLTVDLPGVSKETLVVLFEKGKIKIMGQRFDNQNKVHFEHELNKKIDAKTLKATYAYGVLMFKCKYDAMYMKGFQIKVKNEG